MLTLYIVIPCYKEEAVLPITGHELLSFLLEMIQQGRVSDQSRLLFVDDGSQDGTWQAIKMLVKGDNHCKGIKLSRNFGHQNALWAGMTVAVQAADAIVTIDADLQDDLRVVQEMLTAYEKGADVVYGVRDDRTSDATFKRKSAALFYSGMQRLGVEMVPNHADFRLLSRRATETLLSFKEENLFLRGMVPLIGYPSEEVYYSRKPRMAGESKYPVKKMLQFALEGVTSFSVMPIRLVRNIGLLTFLVGVLYMIYTLVQKLIGNVEIGWSSLIMSIWLLGGIQLISLSIVGEYIGKIYYEVKGRPRFIIEEEL